MAKRKQIFHFYLAPEIHRKLTERAEKLGVCKSQLLTRIIWALDTEEALPVKYVTKESAQYFGRWNQ